MCVGFSAIRNDDTLHHQEGQCLFLGSYGDMRNRYTGLSNTLTSLEGKPMKRNTTPNNEGL